MNHLRTIVIHKRVIPKMRVDAWVFSSKLSVLVINGWSEVKKKPFLTRSQPFSICMVYVELHL